MEKTSNFYCMRFYITYRCNSRCCYCNVWQEKKFRNVAELEYDEAKELIRQCYEAGIRYIDFTGGEPTLHKDLVRLVRYAKSLGIKTEVTSNCVSGWTEQLMETARDTDKFNVSLDTLNQDTYELVRGVNGFGRVMEAMEGLAEIRHPKIMMVISGENRGELDRMVRYAQEKKAEIYLNPMFSYFDEPDCSGQDKDREQIILRSFEPYTVVMLHFMEFLKQEKGAYRPPCSANTRTLTFAPDGSLVLPCYHAVQETIPWNGNLMEMLSSQQFQRYKGGNDKGNSCKNCAVLPYFGISFNYCLDSYFLIQSYSEKLHHLKRDYLNSIQELCINSEMLNKQLGELLRIIRSLQIDRTKPITWLYRAEETEEGYCTEVYREPLTRKQYEKERKAEDCWQLELVPHHFFDQICAGVYREAFTGYEPGKCDEDILDIFQDAAEFQLRWWKLFISKYMKVSVRCDMETETRWVNDYLTRLNAWSKRSGFSASFYDCDAILGMETDN